MLCLLAACRRECGKKGGEAAVREWLPRKFEAQIAVSVGLGVAICMLWPKLQILATCTCALMCAQAGTAQSVRLGLLRPGRLRAAGVSGPYGRPFGLGLLDRGRFLLLGRCLF